MVAVRGMRRGRYITDSGTNYQRRVDDDFYQNADLGWTSGAADPPMPTHIKPRHITGISATTGRRSSIVSPDTTNDLWTNAVTTWVGGTNIQTTDTYTAFRRYGERPSS